MSLVLQRIAFLSYPLQSIPDDMPNIPSPVYLQPKEIRVRPSEQLLFMNRRLTSQLAAHPSYKKPFSSSKQQL